MKVFGFGMVLSAFAFLIFSAFSMYDLYEGFENRWQMVWMAVFEGVFFVFVSGALYYLILRRD